MGIGVRLRTDRDRLRTALVVYVALPAAYIITGWLGLLLAVAPGYATAVFVPAGIAVAAAFIFGPVSLPGTFAASFLLNTWLGFSIGHGVDITKLATAAAIALASTLQAGIGGAVLRRAVGHPAPLDNPRDVVSFVLLSPLICLTSATVSIFSMSALGVIGPGELAINWLTWWIGDSLGVLVATPLMLVVAGQPRSLWRLRFWYVAVPMILCFAMFVSIFARVRSWEERESLTQFQLRSQQLTDGISAALSQQALFLEQLSSSLVHRSNAVSRTDFHGLAQALLERFPAIQAVEWAPRISGDRREAFETEQRSDAPGFLIRERGPSGQMESAAARAEYYPVTYMEPFAGNELAEGFDLASNANRRHAIDAALAGSTVAATAPTRLVQETGAEAGVLLICPVSSGPSGPGVVLIALRMDSFVRSLAHPFEFILGVKLIDVDGGVPLSDALAGRPPAYESAFAFAMRRYLVQTSPSSRYLAEHWAWQSWTVLAGGVLCTGLLGALLMLGTGYAYRVRTNEEELEAIVNRTPFMLTRCSRDLHYRFVSSSYAEMIGKKPEDVAGRPIVEIMGEQGLATILPHVHKVLQGERVEYESEVQFAGVGSRVLHVTYTPERDGTGDVQGWVASINDISDRKRSEDVQKTLVSELRHRNNNLLAVVQAIASQTLSGGSFLPEARKAFEGRLQALARATRLLTKSNWSLVSLNDLVRSELDVFSGRATIHGEDTLLAAQAAQNLALGLHELATNAVKYGALSDGNGSIVVSWKASAEDHKRSLSFKWEERGGPVPTQRAHRGYGTSLLHAVFANVHLDYLPSGLVCEFDMRLEDAGKGPQS